MYNIPCMKSGMILYNKKTGITSFDALKDIKRALGTGKVGHTGTLDKFASGLLIVLVGRALRLSKWFLNCDKKYRGKICFGSETDTLDPEGEVIAEAALPSCEDVKNVLSRFTGEILQEPPAYSAIHVNGQRASSLARNGAMPEMKKRPVTVYELELLSWQPPYADIFVHCSSGTYIRSLARDIALGAGSRAHLKELTRTQVAGFTLEDVNACDVKPISKDVISNLGLPYFDVNKNEKEKILHGKPLSFVPQSPDLNSFAVKSAAVFEGEDLIAVIEKEDGRWKYGCVLSGS